MAASLGPLAHEEWKAPPKCLLICVPGAQKPTKDHVAGCKHTNGEPRLCAHPCVFTRSPASFVASNKHDSVVRSRVNICVQIAACLPDGHLVQTGTTGTASPAHARGSSDHRGLSSRVEPKVFFFFSSAKLVCPTALTFGPTPPVATGVDNQRNLRGYFPLNKLGKAKKGTLLRMAFSRSLGFTLSVMKE